MSSHAPWSKPPIQEVVFEVRFPAVKDYSLFAGGMAMDKKSLFPRVDMLPAQNFPSSIKIAGLVRHRFQSKNKELLFQTGSDVISVNAISYSGFDNFVSSIVDVLETADNYVQVGNVSRIGLRYINRFDNVENPFKILKLTSPFPNIDIASTRRIQTNYIQSISNLISRSINIDFPVGESSLIFDVDVSQTNVDEETLPWKIQDFITWIDDAHKSVWSCFDGLVSDDEKRRRM